MNSFLTAPILTDSSACVNFRVSITRKNPSKPLRACHVCGKTFAKSYSLSRHLKLHTGTKEYQCQFCSFEFIQKSDLKRHLATHSDVKSFVCSFEKCGKRFRTQRNMHSHAVSIHLKRRNFECSVCQMQFKYYNTLRLHRKRVHEATNEAAFVCDYCGKLILVKQYLRSHLTRHVSKPKNDSLKPRTLCYIHPRYFTYLQSPNTPVQKHGKKRIVILQEVAVKSKNLEEELIKFEICENTNESEERCFLWSLMPIMQQMRLSDEKRTFKEGVRKIINKILTM